jgi:hypothetical protein
MPEAEGLIAIIRRLHDAQLTSVMVDQVVGDEIEDEREGVDGTGPVPEVRQSRRKSRQHSRQRSRLLWRSSSSLL